MTESRKVIFSAIMSRLLENFSPHFNMVLSDIEHILHEHKIDIEEMYNYLFEKFPRQIPFYQSMLENLSHIAFSDRDNTLLYLTKTLKELVNKNYQSFIVIQNSCVFFDNNVKFHSYLLYYFSLFFVSDLICQIISFFPNTENTNSVNSPIKGNPNSSLNSKTKKDKNMSLNLSSTTIKALARAGHLITTSEQLLPTVHVIIVKQWSVIYSILSEKNHSDISEIFSLFSTMSDFTLPLLLFRFIRLDVDDAIGNIFVEKILTLCRQQYKKKNLTNSMLESFSFLLVTLPYNEDTYQMVYNFAHSIRNDASLWKGSVILLTNIYMRYPKIWSKAEKFYNQKILNRSSKKNKLEVSLRCFELSIMGRNVMHECLFWEWGNNPRASPLSFIQYNSWLDYSQFDPNSFSNLFMKYYFNKSDFSICPKAFRNTIIHIASLDFKQFLIHVVPRFLELEFNDSRFLVFLSAIPEINSDDFFNNIFTKISKNDITTFNLSCHSKILEVLFKIESCSNVFGNGNNISNLLNTNSNVKTNRFFNGGFFGSKNHIFGNNNNSSGSKENLNYEHSYSNSSGNYEFSESEKENSKNYNINNNNSSNNNSNNNNSSNNNSNNNNNSKVNHESDFYKSNSYDNNPNNKVHGVLVRDFNFLFESISDENDQILSDILEKWDLKCFGMLEVKHIRSRPSFEQLDLISHLIKTLPFILTKEEDINNETVLKIIFELSCNIDNRIASASYDLCSNFIVEKIDPNVFIEVSTELNQYSHDAEKTFVVFSLVHLMMKKTLNKSKRINKSNINNSNDNNENNTNIKEIRIDLIRRVEIIGFILLSSVYPLTRSLGYCLIKECSQRIKNKCMLSFFKPRMSILEKTVKTKMLLHSIKEKPEYELPPASVISFETALYSHFYDVWLFFLAELLNILICSNFKPFLGFVDEIKDLLLGDIMKRKAHPSDTGIILVMLSSSFHFPTLVSSSYIDFSNMYEDFSSPSSTASSPYSSTSVNCINLQEEANEVSEKSEMSEKSELSEKSEVSEISEKSEKVKSNVKSNKPIKIRRRSSKDRRKSKDKSDLKINKDKSPSSKERSSSTSTCKSKINSSLLSSSNNKKANKSQFFKDTYSNNYCKRNDEDRRQEVCSFIYSLINSDDEHLIDMGFRLIEHLNFSLQPPMIDVLSYVKGKALPQATSTVALLIRMPEVDGFYFQHHMSRIISYITSVQYLFMESELNSSRIIKWDSENEQRVACYMDLMRNFCIILITAFVFQIDDVIVSEDIWPLTSRQVIIRFLINWATTNLSVLKSLRKYASAALVTVTSVGPFFNDTCLFDIRSAQLFATLESDGLPILYNILHFHLDLSLQHYIDVCFSLPRALADLYFDAILRVVENDKSTSFIHILCGQILFLANVFAYKEHPRAQRMIEGILGIKEISAIVESTNSKTVNKQIKKFFYRNKKARLRRQNKKNRFDSNNSGNNLLLNCNNNSSNNINSANIGNSNKFDSSDDYSSSFDESTENDESDDDNSDNENYLICSKLPNIFQYATEAVFEAFFRIIKIKDRHISTTDLIESIRPWIKTIRLLPKQVNCNSNIPPLFNIFTPYEFLVKLCEVTESIEDDQFRPMISLWIDLADCPDHTDLVPLFLTEWNSYEQKKRMFEVLLETDSLDLPYRIANRCSFAFFFHITNCLHRSYTEENEWLGKLLANAFHRNWNFMLPLLSKVIHFAFIFRTNQTKRLFDILCRNLKIECFDGNIPRKILRNVIDKFLLILSSSSIEEWGNEALKWILGCKDLEKVTISFITYNRIMKPYDESIPYLIVRCASYHISKVYERNCKKASFSNVNSNKDNKEDLVTIDEESDEKSLCDFIGECFLFFSNSKVCVPDISIKFVSSFLDCRLFIESGIFEDISNMFIQAIMRNEEKIREDKQLIISIVRPHILSIEKDQNSRIFLDKLIELVDFDELEMIALPYFKVFPLCLPSLIKKYTKHSNDEKVDISNININDENCYINIADEVFSKSSDSALCKSLVHYSMMLKQINYQIQNSIFEITEKIVNKLSSKYENNKTSIAKIYQAAVRSMSRCSNSMKLIKTVCIQTPDVAIMNIIDVFEWDRNLEDVDRILKILLKRIEKNICVITNLCSNLNNNSITNALNNNNNDSNSPLIDKNNYDDDSPLINNCAYISINDNVKNDGNMNLNNVSLKNELPKKLIPNTQNWNNNNNNFLITSSVSNSNISNQAGVNSNSSNNNNCSIPTSSSYNSLNAPGNTNSSMTITDCHSYKQVLNVLFTETLPKILPFAAHVEMIEGMKRVKRVPKRSAKTKKSRRIPTMQSMSSSLSIIFSETHVKAEQIQKIKPLPHPKRLILDDIFIGLKGGSKSGKESSHRLSFEKFFGNGS